MAMPRLVSHALTLAATLAMAPAFAQDAVAAFYKGRTINLYIASSVGGGYDTYARLLARHFTKYIPGAPTILPANMTGAGGNVAAGYIANIAAKDGTAIALVLPGTITEPLYAGREKFRHDPATLAYLGSANSEVNMCYARADSGISTAADLTQRELIIGASAEGGSTRDQPAVQNNLLGHKFRIVSGYPGSREIFLAIEKNEVSGVCGLGLPAVRQQRADWLEKGFLRILTQDNAKGDATLTAMGVPRTIDLARSSDDRQIMELIYSQQNFGRPFIMASETPTDRLAALRQAFMQALADKDLLAEAERLKIDISPIAGDELQAIVAKIYATPPALIERARAALIYKPPGWSGPLLRAP